MSDPALQTPPAPASPPAEQASALTAVGIDPGYRFTPLKLGLLLAATVLFLLVGVGKLISPAESGRAVAVASPSPPAGARLLDGEAAGGAAGGLAGALGSSLTEGSGRSGLTAEAERLPLRSTTPPTASDVAPPPGPTGDVEEAGLPVARAAEDVDPPLDDDLSAAAMRGGLTMGRGFLLGFALRAAVRAASLLLGLYLLSLGLLGYAGWIEVHWDVIQAQLGYAVQHIGQELSSFQTFLAGSLPSAGAGALGLTVGLRRD